MKIVYFATAEIACPLLDTLSQEHEVLAVFTQPDRPQGRKRKLAACPVKASALELGIPVYTPEKIGDAESMEVLEGLGHDLQVVFAYGQYLPSKVTELPPQGSINIHPSMLPRYRGAAPIQWAIADGLKETGISLIRVSKEMDAGDILHQYAVSIGSDMTSEDLSKQMAEEACRLTLEGLELMQEPGFEATRQDGRQATEARKLTVEDRAIDWSRTADVIRNKIRSHHPWPGSTCVVADIGIKVFASAVEAGSGTPGEVLSLEGAGPLMACGKDALRLLEVQPPGKTRMPAEDWLRGLK